MKNNIFFALLTVLTFAACDLIDTGEIRGKAVVVDNFKDKNPRDGVYIELIQTADEGRSYDFLHGVTTDKNGFFEIDVRRKTCFDCWTLAKVYSDVNKTDTLGEFDFYAGDERLSYQTIRLDTFSLSHKVWLVPRIVDLGGFEPDLIVIEFTAFNKRVIYNGAVSVNQTFPATEMDMSMQIQHWLNFGSRDLAIGRLQKEAAEIGFGYFKAEQKNHTVEGDTLYIDFSVVK